MTRLNQAEYNLERLYGQTSKVNVQQLYLVVVLSNSEESLITLTTSY